MSRLWAPVQLAQALAEQLGCGTLLLGTLSARTRQVDMSTRHLILVLGDQLDRDAAWRTQCAKKKDRVLMIEARGESTRIPSHKARTALTTVGVIVGILDTGFKREHDAFNEPGHPVDVIAEWDFVNDDGIVEIRLAE